MFYVKYIGGRDVTPVDEGRPGRIVSEFRSVRLVLTDQSPSVQSVDWDPCWIWSKLGLQGKVDLLIIFCELHTQTYTCMQLTNILLQLENYIEAVP